MLGNVQKKPFPSLSFTGETWYITNEKECNAAAAALWKHAGSGGTVVGFDTEWTCKKQLGSTHPPTAIVQICTGPVCYIFHLPKILRRMLGITTTEVQSAESSMTESGVRGIIFVSAGLLTGSLF